MTDIDATATDTTAAPRPGWGAERSRTITWNDPAPTLEISRTMSGLAYLEGLRDGAYPPPPIAQLLGMRNGTSGTIAGGFVIVTSRLTR